MNATTETQGVRSNGNSGAKLFGVDAFTSEAFRGNPAAVCLLDQPAAAEWMQSVAAEMNLSETAFVVRRPGGWGLRWFTPKVEVDLCGHATLASAHVLWSIGVLAATEPAVFHTEVSGVLTCRRDGDGIRMDFPAREPREECALPGLLEALGCGAVWVGRVAQDWVVQVASEAVVRGLSPDHAALGRLSLRGVIVTAAGERGSYDFVSRFFVPGAGIEEDPVTGAAHCALGPFWQSRLNKTEFKAWQASARGGEIGLKVLGTRVELRGRAVSVWRGEWLCV